MSSRAPQVGVGVGAGAGPQWMSLEEHRSSRRLQREEKILNQARIIMEKRKTSPALLTQKRVERLNQFLEQQADRIIKMQQEIRDLRFQLAINPEDEELQDQLSREERILSMVTAGRATSQLRLRLTHEGRFDMSAQARPAELREASPYEERLVAEDRRKQLRERKQEDKILAQANQIIETRRKSENESTQDKIDKLTLKLKRYNAQIRELESREETLLLQRLVTPEDSELLFCLDSISKSLRMIRSHKANIERQFKKFV